MKLNPSQKLSRRQMLGSLGVSASVFGLGGCLSLSQPGASDVMIYNGTNEAMVLSVTITASNSEEPNTSRSIEVTPGERTDPVNQGKLPLNTNYTINVTVENGPSETFAWKDPTVTRAPLYVFIDGSRNIKFLLQAG